MPYGQRAPALAVVFSTRAGEASDDLARTLQLATRITARELPETPSHSFATHWYGRHRDAMDSVA